MSPIGVALAGGEVLLGPVGVEYARRALVVALSVHHRNGRTPPAGLVELAEVLTAGSERAQARSTSASTSAEVSAAGAGAQSRELDDLLDPITTKEAATMLGCTTRNVTDRCARKAFVSARKTPAGWLVERDEVLERLAG